MLKIRIFRKKKKVMLIQFYVYVWEEIIKEFLVIVIYFKYVNILFIFKIYQQVCNIDFIVDMVDFEKENVFNLLLK